MNFLAASGKFILIAGWAVMVAFVLVCGLSLVLLLLDALSFWHLNWSDPYIDWLNKNPKEVMTTTAYLSFLVGGVLYIVVRKSWKAQ